MPAIGAVFDAGASSSSVGITTRLMMGMREASRLVWCMLGYGEVTRRIFGRSSV